MAVTIGHVDVSYDVILRDKRTGELHEVGTITQQVPVSLSYVPQSDGDKG